MFLELLAAIERLPIVEALKVSFFVYPLVNAFHILSVGAVVTTIVLMDLRLLGAMRSVPAESFLRLMRRVAVLAFGAAAITGAALFSIRAQEYAANPAFQIKMGLLVLAGLNLAVYRALAGVDPSPGTHAPALALISIVIWIAVLIAGRFIGFL